MLIREANSSDAAGIARVHVDSWRTTYPGLVPEDVLANLSYERSASNWRQVLSSPDRVVFVAEGDAGEIVGFASGGPERTGNKGYDGELYAIYLLQGFQKQGIGSRLILALATRLAALGRQSLFVWVFSDNPARSFYEKIGGIRVTEQVIEIGSARLMETGYGWGDIHALIENLKQRTQ